MLVGVATAGMHGVFGEFAGAVAATGDFAFLSILAFAIGLQNAAVATSTGLLVRTTHMTGPATDLGVHLASAVYARGAARQTSLRHAALRTGKITAFATGGIAGALLADRYEFGAFFVPAFADSRVPSEIVFDCGLGDLFVCRVAGNVCAPSLVGSVEFAASTFGTQLVVVGAEYALKTGAVDFFDIPAAFAVTAA